MIAFLIIALAIGLAMFSAVVAVATIIVKKAWFSTNQQKSYKTKSSSTTRTNNCRNDGKIYSATGWVWNEHTKLWEPPDYIENVEPMVKKTRTGPTYEEWKAAREAEQNKDKSTN